MSALPLNRLCVITTGLAFTALLCGCGEQEESTKTVTVTESSTAGSARTATEPEAPQEAEPLTLAERAEAVVKKYYAAVDSSLYKEAWGLLSPALQAEQGGFSAWKAGYATTVETRPSEVEAIAATRDSATVRIELAATDLDACGATVDQTFAGTWSLTGAGKSFLGSAFDVQKTGGGTPSTDASACGGGGGAPAVQSGCDPNYTGCVPPYPPDVDCIDVREEVEVVGEDVHRLDIGGDDEACEFFLK